MPEDALLEPLLHHVAGGALAQMGETGPAADAFMAALDAARASELPFETALALDGLESLDPSPARRAERDALLAQLDIVRLPRPPLARPLKAAAPAC